MEYGNIHGMTRARRVALTAFVVGVLSAGLAAFLGGSEINMHVTRGIVTVGMYAVGTIAGFVFVIALIAALAEIISRTR